MNKYARICTDNKLNNPNDYNRCQNSILAIPSVEVQDANWTKVYCPEEALCFGTLFPELNLPFIGSGR